MINDNDGNDTSSSIMKEICEKDFDFVVNINHGLRLILDCLLSFSSNRQFISISSAEKIGNETIAKRVYSHPLIEKHFDFRAWITLPEELDQETQSLRYILDSIKGEQFSEENYNESDQSTGEYLFQHLKSKRYLIVIDDIQGFDLFSPLRKWFPEDKNGSRVMVTSMSEMKISTYFDIGGTYQGLNLLKCPVIFHEFTNILAEGSFPSELEDFCKETAEIYPRARELLYETFKGFTERSKTPQDWEDLARELGCVLKICLPNRIFCILVNVREFSAETDTAELDYERKEKPKEDDERKEKQKEDESSAAIRGNEQENVVFGLESDVIKIKEQLTGKPRYLQCVTIVGMGGIGKTTLAKAVFNDPLIRYHFYRRAWITVSQVYQLKELLLEILQNVGHPGDEINGMSKEQLSEKVYRQLKGQRFLIVMDDMWSTEVWDYLKTSFPDDKNGSRILLTSRLTSLANHVNPNISPHQMRFLDKEQSWKLLHCRITLKQSYPQELMEIGKRIAEKCKGLPLAILVVAGVLSNMLGTLDVWENVAETMNAVLTSDPEQYLGILAMSYNYLPQQLKPCFLYLCAFPEDCEIECRRLIRLWIAEGFVEPKSSTTLEIVAEEYLEELIKRGLISVGKRSSSGNIKTCCIHDLLRDLSHREAKKQNFMQVMSKRVQVSSDGNIALHRLCFHYGSFGDFQSENSLRNTRSLLCFEVGFDIIKDIHLCLSKFELLRVLDIGFVRFDYFPLLILRLSELRFLAFTAACELPSSISDLRNLQTLIVQGPWISRRHGKTPDLPMEFWKLSELRHLNLTAAVLLASPLFNEDVASSSLVLENLQTLCTVRPTSCTEQLFRSMPNLKKLGIRQIKEDLETDNGQSNFLNSLVLLHQLETLKCSFYVQNRRIMHLPECNAFPQRLKNLTLSGSYFPWTDIDTLATLPNLEILKLKNYAFHGPIWEANEDGFKKLKVLLVEKTDLVHWKASRYSFTLLESLVLRFCESLEEIPNEIGDNMQLIELHCCTSSAESSAWEIQEEQRNRDNDELVIRIISEGYVKQNTAQKSLISSTAGTL